MDTQTSRNQQSFKQRSETISKLKPLRTRTEHDLKNTTHKHHPLPHALPGTRDATRTKQGHSYRRAAKDTVQSAFELRPPITFEHLLRRDRRTPVHSRRNSNEDFGDRTDIAATQEQTVALRKQIGTSDVNRIVEQNERREAELRQALQHVEEQGTSCTRRLDDTYYVLLERVEALRQIVESLQALAKDSKALRSRFETETEVLKRDTIEDLDQYDHFDGQEKSISSLLQRLERSKERTTALNTRLDAANQRVEVSKQRILTAQVQRRKRWRVVWALSAIVIVVLLGIWIAKKNAELNVRLRAHGDNIMKIAGTVSSLVAAPSPSEDPYLRDLFDGIS